MKSSVASRKQRFWALLLAVVMVVGLLPTAGVKADNKTIKKEHWLDGADEAEATKNGIVTGTIFKAGDTITGDFVGGQDRLSVTYLDVAGTPIASDAVSLSYQGDDNEVHAKIVTEITGGDSIEYEDDYSIRGYEDACSGNIGRLCANENVDNDTDWFSDYWVVIYDPQYNPRDLRLQAIPKYSIKWDYNGGQKETGANYPETYIPYDIEAQKIVSTTIDLTNFKPTKANYLFAGWEVEVGSTGDVSDYLGDDAPDFTGEDGAFVDMGLFDNKINSDNCEVLNYLTYESLEENDGYFYRYSIRLRAKWMPYYTINYKKGIGDMATGVTGDEYSQIIEMPWLLDDEYYDDGFVDHPQCTYEKDGYYFNGWVYADGSTAGEFEKMQYLDPEKKQYLTSGASIDLYADWKATQSYIIHFEKMSYQRYDNELLDPEYVKGKIPDIEIKDYNPNTDAETIIGLPTGYSLEGYYLDGWDILTDITYEDDGKHFKDCENPKYFSLYGESYSDPTKANIIAYADENNEVSLYAWWVKDYDAAYLITFDNNEDSLSKENILAPSGIPETDPILGYYFVEKIIDEHVEDGEYGDDGNLDNIDNNDNNDDVPEIEPDNDLGLGTVILPAAPESEDPYHDPKHYKFLGWRVAGSNKAPYGANTEVTVRQLFKDAKLEWVSSKDTEGEVYTDMEKQIEWRYLDEIPMEAVWEARTYDILFDVNAGENTAFPSVTPSPANLDDKAITGVPFNSTENVEYPNVVDTAGKYGVKYWSLDSSKVMTITSAAEDDVYKVANIVLRAEEANMVLPPLIIEDIIDPTTGNGYAPANNQKEPVDGVITFYAIWDEYVTVTYYAPDADGGAVPDVQKGFDDESVKIAGNTGNLTRAGYSFVGWNTSETGENGQAYSAGDEISLDKGNVELYAQWSLNDDVTLKFYKNDGSEDYTSITAPEGSIIELPDADEFAFNGHHMDCWSNYEDEEDAGNDLKHYGFREEIAIYEGALYAFWITDDFTIRYDYNAPADYGKNLAVPGQGYVNAPYDEGSDVPLYMNDNVDTDAYKFLGWSLKDKTATADFDSFDGTSIKAVVDKAIEDEVTPTSGEDAEVTEYTIYGVWEKKKYEVAFEDSDGTPMLVNGKESNQYEYGVEGKDIILPIIPDDEEDLEGIVRFSGWNPEISDVTDNVTYVAQYDEIYKLYDIVFVTKDGEIPQNVESDIVEEDWHELEYTDDAVLPNNITDKDSVYNFAGWAYYDGEKLVPVEGKSIADLIDELSEAEVIEEIGEYHYQITLYALWTDKPVYTVTWKNGTDTLYKDDNVIEGSKPIFNGEIPVEPVDADDAKVYTFAGWSSNGQTYKPGEEFPAVEGDVTYTAVFDSRNKNTFKITWMKNEDEVLYSGDITEGDIPEYPYDDPVKEDAQYSYDFMGWSTEPDGEEIEVFAPAEGDLIFYALFDDEVKEYTVKFDANGHGKIADNKKEQVLVYGSSLVDCLPELEEYGYTLEGWYTIIDGEEVLWDLEEDTVYGDITLKAKWTANVYGFKYDMNKANAPELDADPASIANDSKAYDENITFKKVSDKTEKYSFLGWARVDGAEDADFNAGQEYKVEDILKEFEDSEIVDGTITLYAIWTTNPTYKVIWKDGNGDILQEDIVVVGSKNKPQYRGATPTKDSDKEHTYVFTGDWEEEEDEETGDITKKPVFEPQTRQYTVKFIDYDNREISLKDYDYGTTKDKIEAPANPTRNGYTFKGWDPAIADVTDNATYKATYEIVNDNPVNPGGNGGNNDNPNPPAVTYYTITWKDDDGTVLRTDRLAAGSTPSYGSTPSRAATEEYTYIFSGWTPSITSVSGDATYTASYSGLKITPSPTPEPEPTGEPAPPKEYKIKYYEKTDDGKLVRLKKTGNPDTYTYGVGAKITKGIEKDGYKFVGWYSVKTNKEVTKISATSKGTKKLYALFTPIDDGDSNGGNNGAGGSATDFGLLCAKLVNYGVDSMSLTWSIIDGVDGYEVYGSQCNSADETREYQLIDDIKKADLTADEIELGTCAYEAKNLKPGTYYKFYVKAYILVNNEKRYIETSVNVHGVTLNDKYGVADEINIDKITLKGKKSDKVLYDRAETGDEAATEINITLKVGQSIIIEASEFNKDGKIIRPHRPISFQSDDSDYAKVGKKYKHRYGKAIEGKDNAYESYTIKALKATEKDNPVTIWVYAQNGIYTKCNITIVNK